LSLQQLTRLLFWHIFKPAIFSWLYVVAVDHKGVAPEQLAAAFCAALRALLCLRSHTSDEVLSYLLFAASLYCVAHTVNEAAVWLSAHVCDDALPSWLVLTSASACLHIHDL
jgi:hypothetical protein